MTNTSRFTSLTVALSLVLVSVACSSPPPESLGGAKENINGTEGKGGPSGSGGPTKGGDKTTTAPTQSQSPAPATDGGTTQADPDQACYAQAADACETCCETNHQAAFDAWEAAYDACICGTAGKCQTECAATYCSDDDNSPDEVEGDACDLCQKKNAPEDGTGACDAALAAALAGAQGGAALDHCWEECP